MTEAGHRLKQIRDKVLWHQFKSHAVWLYLHTCQRCYISEKPPTQGPTLTVQCGWPMWIVDGVDPCVAGF